MAYKHLINENLATSEQEKATPGERGYANRFLQANAGIWFFPDQPTAVVIVDDVAR